MKIVDFGVEGASGTNAASLTVKEGNGQILGVRTSFTSPAAGTLVFYRPTHDTTANALVAAATSLDIDTDVLGFVDGAVISTNDFVLALDSGSNGYQLQSVSVVGAVSSSVVTLTLGGNITVAAGDRIFIVRLVDIITHTTANETVRDLADFYAGFERFPVHAVLTATGTCRLSTSWQIIDVR